MKNNKKLTTAVISAAILFVSITALPEAFAHPLYNGHKHFWGSTDVCYQSSTLNGLTVNGLIGQYSLVKTELDNARNNWNSQSSPFSFNYQTSCSHWFGATNLSGNTVGQTSVTYDVLGFVNDVDTNYDLSSRTWSTGSSCSTSNPASLRYVAIHELGHWLVFIDASDGVSSHTVMWATYNCNAITVKTADATELDNVY